MEHKCPKCKINMILKYEQWFCPKCDYHISMKTEFKETKKYIRLEDYTNDC